MITEKTKKYTAIFNGYSTSLPLTQRRDYTYEELKKATVANFTKIKNEFGIWIADSKSISLMEDGMEGVIGNFLPGEKVTFTASIQVNADSTYGFDFVDVIFDQQKRPRG